MNKEKLSSLQLFYLMAGYVLGTAIILGLGREVKQDTWLFILIGILGGLVLMAVYTQLSPYKVPRTPHQQFYHVYKGESIRNNQKYSKF